ncbi:hypothetical protein OCA22_28710 [Bacillus cereus]|nr:hypothetical protein [Bacillus cereus]
MENITERLEKINSESLRDGKGVIVHMDDFEWMIKTIEKLIEIKN